MNSHLVIGLALMFAPVILVGSIAIGVFGYSDERALAVRNAEANTAIVVEEVRHISIRRSERYRHGRVDRHPIYICLHVASWGYAWCVFGGAQLTSNVIGMSDQQRYSMAVCFLVGSTLALTGAAMGLQRNGYGFMRGVSDNITSSRLGDDVQLPYTFGAAAMVAMSVSLGIYAWTSFHSTVGSLGGWLTGAMTFGCAEMLGVFVFRIRQFTRVRRGVITEAVQRIEHRHASE